MKGSIFYLFFFFYPFLHLTCFTRSFACFSRSFGAGVEAENQSRDADKPGGGDTPEEAGTAATVRAFVDIDSHNFIFF